MNAVYKITNPGGQTNPGKIIWKLGGSAPTMEPGTRLTISGDPVFSSGGGFGGQHYPRWFDAGDGQLYVTLHDNGSDLGRPPRGVMYRINETAKTATLIEDVRDNASPSMTSPCCGSAGKLPTGNWVMSWGNNPLVTELTPSGSRVFVLTFGAPSYRVGSVLPGAVTREQLRAGMDAQYPRSVSNTPPTISSIANQIINEDTSTAALAFTVGDAQTAAGSLTLGKGSLNTILVPTNNIVFGGSGSNRTVTVTPATNQSGMATITVSVSDGALSASNSFVLTVNPPPPVIVPNLAGQTQTAATNAIISAGLSVGIISNAPHGIVPAGFVISQNPAAATSAPVGSPVNLVISSGATDPVVSEATYQDGEFRVSVPTLSGRLYILQYIDELPGTNWTDLQSVSGDGTLRVLIDSSATNRQRFYRVRME
jgi:hypothetical protein